MLISLQDISIRLGEQPCFEHTSWNIKRGQHWAIWGPSGSGKSTLAKVFDHSLPLIHGQVLYYFDETHPGSGRSYLNPNEVLTFSSETHRAFIRQFVEYSQARWQSFEGQDAPTVAELLDPRSLLAHSPFEILPQERVQSFQQRQHKVMDLFDLSPLLARKVHQLSHGESRKVFLSRLLLRSPKLLILDDPFTGLDASSRVRFRDGIEQLLQNNDPAILFITSRAEEIPPGINQILQVEAMNVVAQGERDALLPIAKQPTAESSKKTGAALEVSSAFSRMVELYMADLKQRLAPGFPDPVRMENVSVAYGETKILKNIIWTVQQGQRWALLGANGAGKSTLLSLILADNPQAYRNQIFLFGQRRGTGESIWEIKQRIGWVSPELQIFYDKTVTCQEVIASGFFDSVGLYHTCSEVQLDAVRGWARAFGIETLLNHPFQMQSSGEQRLILLSRALVKNPILLILDEPCQGLDDRQRANFIHQIKQICARAAVTLIYVTHYAEEIPTSITHYLRLDQGEVQETGKI